MAKDPDPLNHPKETKPKKKREKSPSSKKSKKEKRRKSAKVDVVPPQVATEKNHEEKEQQDDRNETAVDNATFNMEDTKKKENDLKETSDEFGGSNNDDGNRNRKAMDDTSSPRQSKQSDVNKESATLVSDENDMNQLDHVDETISKTATTTSTAITSTTISKPQSPAYPRPPNLLNITVHRVRHLQHTPRPILHLTSTQLTPMSSLVALSREGGSIELLYASQKFRPLAHVPGQPSREVDTATWLCNHQLICGSRDGTVFRASFASMRHERVTGSGGGAVMALESPCRCQRGRCWGVVAVGCESGSIRILDCDDDDEEGEGEFGLVAALPTAGSAVLSLAWRIMGYASRQTSLFAGCADSTIRRYDFAHAEGGASTGSSSPSRHGSWTCTQRITVETLGNSTPTKVWSLVAFRDGTLISGDSLGRVQFWDGTQGIQIASFHQNDSKADVLALTANQRQDTVFASGVDSKVVCIKKIEEEWTVACYQRPHTHDVRALAFCHVQSRGRKKYEMLISGSVDTRLCTYKVHGFEGKKAVKIYPWPPISPVKMACERRVLAMMRENQVDLYRLARREEMEEMMRQYPEVADADDATKRQPEQFVGSVKIKSVFNLACCDISRDGEMLALSDGASLMLFSLKWNDDSSKKTDAFAPDKMTLPDGAKVPCTALQFSHSGRRLVCATSAGPILILNISNQNQTTSPLFTVEHTFKEHLQTKTFAIRQITLSPDEQYLAIPLTPIHQSYINNGATGTIHVFHLPRKTHWWTLPKTEQDHTCLRFFNSSLVVACLNNSFYIYDVSKKCLGMWSRDAGFPISKSIPEELKGRAEFPVFLAFNPSDSNKFLMGAHGYFCAIDLDKPIPNRCQLFPPSDDRRFRTPMCPNFTICVRYNKMLFMDFVAEDELVVVERPWLDVLETLPDAFERKVYGT